MKMPWEKTNDVEPPPQPEPTKEKTPAELIAEALQPLADSFNSFKSDVDAKLEALKPKQPERKATDGDGQPQLMSVLDDENVAFNQRLTPVIIRQLETEARLVKNDIKDEYIESGFGDLWKQFAAEIDQTLDTSPVVDGQGKALRGDPMYIRNVVDMVIGRNARKGGIKFDGVKRSFVLESGTSGSGPTHTPTAVDGLSEAQQKVMQRMGIKLEDGVKTAKKLHFVN